MADRVGRERRAEGAGATEIEPTVMRFAGNTISVALNITLVVAILGYFGVQTTTFAALIAASALAIGYGMGRLARQLRSGRFPPRAAAL
jgi:small conductance mechanosensitive channel